MVRGQKKKKTQTTGQNTGTTLKYEQAKFIFDHATIYDLLIKYVRHRSVSILT